MATDEEKNKLSKLLEGLEIQEIKLPERCNDVLKEIRHKRSEDVKDDDQFNEIKVTYENPYRVDPGLLEENEKKLRELLSRNKKNTIREHNNIKENTPSSKYNKPWRTNSSKEKLLCIDAKLKRHLEKGAEMIMPLSDVEMKDLIDGCTESHLETPTLYTANKLRDTVEAARKELPNFQYRKLYNSTAMEIVQEIKY